RSVFTFTAIVLAQICVGTVSTTVNLSGVSSWTTVIDPSPFDVKAKPVPASKPAASTPSPTAGLAMTLPVRISTTAIVLLPQPANSLLFTRSIANPLGSSQGANGQRASTRSVRGSKTAITLLSSRLA